MKTPQITRILKALQRRVDENISTKVLARNAGVTVDQLYRRINDLRNDGFNIATSYDKSRDRFYYRLAA